MRAQSRRNRHPEARGSMSSCRNGEIPRRPLRGLLGMTTPVPATCKLRGMTPPASPICGLLGMTAPAFPARGVALSLVLCILYGVAPACFADSPWDPVLAAAKLTPKQAQIDPNRWTGGGLYRLDTFQKMWDDWMLVDPTAIAWGKEALEASSSFEALVDFAAPKLGVKLTPPPPELVRQQQAIAKYVNEPLIRAIRDLHIVLGQPLAKAQLDDLCAQAATVPPPVAEAAATVLRAVPQALKLRAQAFAKFGDPTRVQFAYAAALYLAQADDVNPDVLKLMDTVDLDSLLAGGLVMARAVDRAAAQLRAAPKREFSFAWTTPLGKIALNGTQANTYCNDQYLLVMDTGGNDRYEGGVGAGTLTTPVSVALDLGGDDVYDYKQGLGPGCGVCGYGFLLDCAGNDTYRITGPGLGVGIFGVGMLLDEGGKDTYEAQQLGEGCGVFGIGALSDWSGDDTYKCLTQSQGYAGPKGLGLLVDRQGNDSYEADDTHLTNPSPQTAQHNVSLSQGAGFGRRAHPGDGHSLAGGIGMLVDGAGDDKYKCGVFGQGVGYWYAVGMLIDFGGNDSYEGVWYVQGSAAHYAIGALCDLGGNDHYKALMAQSQGQGHDYSIGVLHDAGGKDEFDGPSGCLGSGCWNGIGAFWKQGGDAVFKAGGGALGFGGGARPEAPCFGFFLAEGGNNTYPAGDLAKPHSTWVRTTEKDPPQWRGVGVDR